MPRFFDQDYYFLAIADHTARLNKAIMVIPQALLKHANCCLNAFEMLDPCSDDRKDSPDLSKLVLPDFSREIMLADDVQRETFEVDENNDSTEHDGKELTEIIPSSNPDSSCSLIGSIDGKEGIVHLEEHFCLEQFSLVTLNTENQQVYEEPVSVNYFKLAILALPSISVLLSQLKAVSLEDPLLTPDGTKWQDRDFQCIVDSHDDWSTEVPHVEVGCPFTELFNTVSIYANNDMSSETLLPYMVPSTEYHTTDADIHSSDLITAWTDANCGTIVDTDFLTQDIGLVLSQLNSGLSEFNMVYKSDSEDNNRHTAALSAVESFVPGNCEVLKSPFVEYRNVETVSDDPLSMTLLEAPLNTLAGEKILGSKCSLLDENLETIERYIWEKEKHFDELRFSEPMFQQEHVSSPIAEACVCLRLQQEDIETENEHLKWLFDMQQGKNSLEEITTLSDDNCLQQLENCENFDKFQTSELDYMLSHCTKQTQSLDMNEAMQDTTPEHVDSNLTDESEEDHAFQPLDPLDSFIYVRATSKKNNSIYVKISPPNCNLQTNKSLQMNATTVAASPPNIQCANIRTVLADFSGLWENVLQCIIDSAGVYLEHLKQTVIPRQHQLMDISIDMTQFLLKEREKQMLDVTSGDNVVTSYPHKDSLLQSLAIVHILRTAADLLLHACLESCIAYLAANSEDKPAQIAKTCSEVHQQLFHYQCQFLQENRTHPKLSALIDEVTKCSTENPKSKILIVVENGFKSLACALEGALCQIPELTVVVLKDWKCVNPRQSKTTAFIASIAEARNELMHLFNFVILYDERLNAHIKSWCQHTNISYIGLLTQYSCDTDLTDKSEIPKIMAQITVVCSMEVTQYTQLICLLETGYNITVMEREYHKLCAPDRHIYFADLIVSPTHCIVLLAMEDLKRQWDLTTAITRFVSLGLQFSNCCIILHGLDVGTSYVLEKDVLSNIYKLIAALCSLQGKSSTLNASYQVFIRLKDENVAGCIRDIVDQFLACHSENNLLRPWLSAFPSKEETILLQLSFMNSLSAQKLLHRFTISEILGKSHGELTALFPDIPEKVFKYLHYITSSLKSQQSNLSESSQNSCFTEVSPSNRNAMSTQKRSSFSDRMHDDNTQLACTQTSDLGFTRNVCPQTVQMNNFLDSFQTNFVERYSPAQLTLNTRHTNSNGHLTNQNYNCTAEEHRRRTLQQNSITESAAENRADLSDQSIVCNHLDFCDQSMVVESGKHDAPLQGDKRMCLSDYMKLLPGFGHDGHNNVSVSGSGTIDEANLTADFHKVCHGLQQIKQAQAATGNKIPTCIQSDTGRTYNMPYHLASLTEVCEGNYQTKHLQENTAFRCSHDSTQELQNKSSLVSFHSAANFAIRDTCVDEDSIHCFHRKIARAMQTLDIQTCDKNSSSTMMPQRSFKYVPHNDYRLQMAGGSDREGEITECDLSPNFKLIETASNVGNTHGDYDTHNGSIFSFPVSDTTNKEESSFRLPLYYPVKKEVEDMMYENGNFNLSKEAQLNRAATAANKPAYRLRNNSRFHTYEMSDPYDSVNSMGYQSDKLTPIFLNSEGSSAVILHDNLFASDQTSASDPHGHSAGAAGFGLFSTKAHRDRGIFSTSMDSPSRSVNHATEYPRSWGDLLYDTQTGSCKHSCNSLLSTGGTTDGTMHPDMLPFSVSKELRKHIKKYRTQDLLNFSSFPPPDNQNSVRVSRQPNYGNKEIPFSNSHGLTTVKDPTIQQEFKNCSKKSDTSLHQVFGQMRNQITDQAFNNHRRQPDIPSHQNLSHIGCPVIQQGVQNCRQQSDFLLLQNDGQVRNLKAQDCQNHTKEANSSLYQNDGIMRNEIARDCQNYTKEANSSLFQHNSQTWAASTLTSDCIQPTFGYSPQRIKPARSTNTPESHMHVSPWPSFTSTYSTESSRISTPPHLARGGAVSGVFHHCPSISNATTIANPIRQAAMPYTPRHKVTVGLAQPFRRLNGSLESTNLEPTRQHSDSGGPLRAEPSPPMDLLTDDSNNSKNDDQRIDRNKYLSQIKWNKWNQHLLSCKTTDQSKSATSNFKSGSIPGSCSLASPTENKKRKLQLEKKAGNKGQTVLVFK